MIHSKSLQTVAAIMALACSAVVAPDAVAKSLPPEILTLWEQPFATGDWGEFRTTLTESGVTPFGSYSSVVLGAVSGGIDQGVAYSGWLNLGVDFDLEKLVGWTGGTVRVATLYTHGPSVSGKYVGDLGSLDGYDSYDSFRLYELWFEQSAWDDLLNIRIGLMAFEEEFFVTERSGFMLASGFTSPVGLWSNLPFPTAPDSTLGVRLRISPGENHYLMLAAFDGNPATGNYGDPSRNAAASNEFNHWNTHWAVRQDEGVLLVAEAGWKWNQPPEEEPVATGKSVTATAPIRGLAADYKIGFVFHTDQFTDVYDATVGSLGSSLARDVNRHAGRNWAFYLSADQELWREPGSEDQGLGVFIRGTWSPEDRNFIHYTLIGGVTYKGLIHGRDDDYVALGYSHYKVSDRIASAIRNANRVDGTQEPEPDYEGVLELSYHCHVTGWLTVQPQVQYVLHPGATGAIDNALVVGLVSTIEF